MRNRQSYQTSQLVAVGGIDNFKYSLNFIEDNRARLVNPKETDCKTQDCQAQHDLKVRPWEEEDIIVHNAMR